MAIEIREIPMKRSAVRRFVKFAIDLYEDNDCYVPALVMDEADTLMPDKNPALDFCEARYFMAYRDGRAVGRIAGIINSQVNKRTGEQVMRFGFADFIDDDEVVDALFDAVEAWAREKGMTKLLGPLGFTDMDREGVLTDGYDQLGTMATNYNHPYYVRQLERRAMTREAEWVEFKVMVPDAVPERYARLAEIVAKRSDVRCLSFASKKELVARYGHDLFRLVNEAYDELYGYSPLSERQIEHYLKMYVPIVRLENLSVVVDADDKLVGLGLVMPSLSRALIRSRGRLFPTGWYHLLRALKGKNDIVDLLLVAVKPEYQSKGVNALIFNQLIPTFIKCGYVWAETNPELVVNQRVQSQWQYFDYKLHRRRATYQKAL